MPEQKQENVKESQDRVVRYFCVRLADFPAGRSYNCCESVLLASAYARGIGCARAGELEFWKPLLLKRQRPTFWASKRYFVVESPP